MNCLVRSYFDPIKANMDKELLLKEEINCYLKNINLSDMNWLYTNAIGGIKLIINKSDLEKANEVLNVFESKIPEETGTVLRCPVCNSLEIKIVNPNWLIGLLFILAASFPSPFTKRKYQCSSCGHKWEIEENEE
jgi:Putative prokaryotic signal transducing protein